MLVMYWTEVVFDDIYSNYKSLFDSDFKAKWTVEQQSAYIRSAFSDIPLTPIFIDSTESVIVDGRERFNAIIKYIGSDLRCNNISFNDLISEERERFLKRYLQVYRLDVSSQHDIEVVRKQMNYSRL